MQNLDDDRRTLDGLLLLVSSDGIPLLVRTYGDVRTPPSAAVGIASALFHAAKRDKTAQDAELQLQTLETTHRTVVYELTALGLLLAFVSDKSHTYSSACGSVRRMLRAVYAALVMLVGEHTLQASDGSKLRSAIVQQAQVVDRVATTFHSDPRLLVGRPMRSVTTNRKLDKRDIEDDALLRHGLWLENGVLVGEYTYPSANARLDASELLVLVITAECVARRECNYTHHVARVSVPSLQSDVKVGICNNSTSPPITFIGIFDEQMEDDEALRKAADKLLACWKTSAGSSPESVGSKMDGQLRQLPDALVCCYISRMTDVPSPSCRMLAYLQPSWRSTTLSQAAFQSAAIQAGESTENFWWRELTQFTAQRLETVWTAQPSVTGSSSFKREEEGLTFLHHTRGPVQCFSVFVGRIGLTETVGVGDTLISALLAIK